MEARFWHELQWAVGWLVWTRRRSERFILSNQRIVDVPVSESIESDSNVADKCESSVRFSFSSKNLSETLNESIYRKLRNNATVSCASKPVSKCNPLMKPCLFDVIADP